MRKKSGSNAGRKLAFGNEPSATFRGKDLYFSECRRYKVVHIEDYDDRDRIKHRWYADRFKAGWWVELSGSPYTTKEEAVTACRKHAGDWSDEDESAFKLGQEWARKGTFRIPPTYLKTKQARRLWFAGFDSVAGPPVSVISTRKKRRKRA